MENNPADDILEEAKEHILRASQLLKKLGPDYSTISWMVEDILTYVDNAANGEVPTHFEEPEEENVPDPKQVTLKGFVPR